MKRTTSLIASLAMLCLAPAAETALAAPVYLDASTTNTAFAPSAGGGALTTTAGDTVDGIWRLRTSLGIAPSATTIPVGTITPTAANNVLESTGNSNPSDNVPRIVTTVGGLSSNTYNVYVLYWTDQIPNPWRIRAGLTDTTDPLPLFIGGNAPSPSAPVNQDAGAGDNGTGGAGQGRRLWIASLGQVTGTSISVFVEDGPATTNNERTWYDGIAYEPVPEPTAWTLASLAAVAGLRSRRRQCSRS